MNQKSVLDITINLRSKTPPKVLRNQSAEQANGPNLGKTYRTNALNPVTIMSLLLPVRLAFWRETRTKIKQNYNELNRKKEKLGN